MGQEEDDTVLERWHEADEKGDVKSLDRYGQRNLYLVVRSQTQGGDVWKFPEGEIQPGELLHEVCFVSLWSEDVCVIDEESVCRLRSAIWMSSLVSIWIVGSSAGYP